MDDGGPINDSGIVINFGKLREAGIKMFFEIVEIFDKYHFKYWLDYGTLLGAVREGKIIPWDGEFDLSAWDSDIDMNSSIWDEIRELGYIINIDEYHIKIKKQNVKIGAFIIDLHKYQRENNEAVYLYGKIPKTGFGKLYNKLMNLINAQLPLEKSTVFLFMHIYSTAINNTNYTVDEIDNKNIIFRKGSLKHSSFTLEIDGKRYVSRNRSSVKHPITKFAVKVIEFLPMTKRSIVYKILSPVSNKIKYTGHIKVSYPQDHFLKFEKITFCRKEFRCPFNKELYLERIYGEDWHLPRTKWELSTDSPSFGKGR